ncbi:MAG: hypothetical protein CMO74_14580 [Verrucomicrobiales bacterium]|nr:hypothetical protein [Verrucomicrobiales bacterium]|tara:strand:+ start:35007 stop:35603 length:597 start_codon:yes stop_codon:yes gene_type:complete
METELLTAIATIVSSIATLVGVWAKRKWSERHKNTVEGHVRAGSNVNTALKYTKQMMSSGRAYVLEFHNGGHFFSGRGQQKFSCTHETVEAGISSECIHSQDHRVSNYSEYITELVSVGSFSCLDINEIRDSGFRSLLNSKGVQAIYNVPITTLNGKVIGILGVDYISKIEAFPVDVEGMTTEEFMQNQAKLIAGYLI